jgi:hypothetical protein
VIDPSQIGMPLPPLKPMAQSRCGVTHVMGAQVRPMVVAISRFIPLINLGIATIRGRTYASTIRTTPRRN